VSAGDEALAAGEAVSAGSEAGAVEALAAAEGGAVDVSTVSGV
jgi:hypothetical protein